MSKYVHIAKRENNNKRGFLIVNPYLGKHIAKNPKKILKMFDEMAEKFPKNMNPKQTLVIGFAETATALGLHYACKNKCYFVQTTREKISGEYLYFAEEHSHATAQYISKNSMDKHVHHIKNIVFVDDEITTGKTVLNAISAIEKAYPDRTFHYHVVSVLNSMDHEQKATYKKKNIGLSYLSEISNKEYEHEANLCKLDGEYNVADMKLRSLSLEYCVGLPDTRYIVDTEKYQKSLDNVLNTFHFHPKNKRVLVLGVEEFMYPGIQFAERLYDEVDRVKFCATTRSPIAVSKNERYPLHERFQFHSVNEQDRNTYFYDMKAYDEVFIFCERKYKTGDGIYELVNALHECGVKKITMIQF